MSTIGNPLPYTNENDMEIDNDTDMNALPTVGDGERVQVNATTLTLSFLRPLKDPFFDFLCISNLLDVRFAQFQAHYPSQ